MLHGHSYNLKEEKYSGDYVKHFSTSASVGTMQKNQWYIKSQLTFTRNWKVKKDLRRWYCILCAQGVNLKINCYILLLTTAKAFCNYSSLYFFVILFGCVPPVILRSKQAFNSLKVILITPPR